MPEAEVFRLSVTCRQRRVMTDLTRTTGGKHQPLDNLDIQYQYLLEIPNYAYSILDTLHNGVAKINSTSNHIEHSKYGPVTAIHHSRAW